MRPHPTDLVTWSVEHGIGELFLGVTTELTPEEMAWLRAVVVEAREAGIRVAALGGDDAWLGHPRKARAWARGVVATGLFDAVHVELEPWNSDDWLTRRNDLVRDYLAVLKAVSQVCPIPLEADITFWLHEVPARSGRSLDEAVMRIVDGVTLLSFRTTATGADSIMGVGARGLAAAHRAGIPCRLAMETRDLGPDAQSSRQSFHGLGLAALESALESVDHLGARDASYNGVAIKTSIAGEAPTRRWRRAR